MRTVPADALAAIMTPGHQPVLLHEVLEFLSPKANGRYLDATFGGGGHTRALLASASGVSVTAFDRDPAAAPRAAELAAEFGGRLELVNHDFGRLVELPAADFDGVLFDPPRAGAAEQAAAIAASTVQKVVGVSCNPATFARDASLLIAGGFRLVHVRPVDQFLWSPHIELVGVFER